MKRVVCAVVLVAIAGVGNGCVAPVESSSPEDIGVVQDEFTVADEIGGDPTDPGNHDEAGGGALPPEPGGDCSDPEPSPWRGKTATAAAPGPDHPNTAH